MDMIPLGHSYILVSTSGGLSLCLEVEQQLSRIICQHGVGYEHSTFAAAYGCAQKDWEHKRRPHDAPLMSFCSFAGCSAAIPPGVGQWCMTCQQSYCPTCFRQPLHHLMRCSWKRVMRQKRPLEDAFPRQGR